MELVVKLLALSLTIMESNNLSADIAIKSLIAPFHFFNMSDFGKFDIGKEAADNFLSTEFQLFCSCFPAASPLSSLLSLDLFDRLVGMLQANCLQTCVFSPLHKFFDNIKHMPAHESNHPIALMGFQIFRIYQIAVTKVGGFPRINVCGLYPTYSCLNHACVPNIAFALTEEEQQLSQQSNYAQVSVRAISDIRKGDEILSCYILPSNTQLKRWTELRQKYFFECACAECVPCLSMVCIGCGASRAVSRCTRCKRVSYCSKKCQQKDWRQHKLFCVEKK